MLPMRLSCVDVNAGPTSQPVASHAVVGEYFSAPSLYVAKTRVRDNKTPTLVMQPLVDVSQFQPQEATPELQQTCSSLFGKLPGTHLVGTHTVPSHLFRGLCASDGTGVLMFEVVPGFVLHAASACVGRWNIHLASKLLSCLAGLPLRHKGSRVCEFCMRLCNQAWWHA